MASTIYQGYKLLIRMYEAKCFNRKHIYARKNLVLGASPDGLVGTNALLEVKWPLMQRDSTIEETIVSGNLNVKKE